MSPIIVDCDASPIMPSWAKEVVEHRRCGLVNPEKTRLYLAPEQEKGMMVGNDLRTHLADKPVMNVNLLDWYMVNPKEIPESWKGKAVFFWGTIYRGRDGHLCVRYLHWYGDRWCECRRWLDDDWYAGSPALLSAE